MKEARCELQCILLFGVGLAWGLIQLVGGSYLLAVFGPQPRTVVFFGLLAIITAGLAYVVQKCFARYRYDDERIERRAVVGSGSLAWADVTDLRIRRSGGESAVVLIGRNGRELCVDFHLLARNGVDLLATLMRRLEPMLRSKLVQPSREVVRYRRRLLGLTLPGSILVGPEEIARLGWPSATHLPIAEVREVAIRLVRSLLPTQDYRISGVKAAIEFRSSIENSPLLIRHLRTRLSEDIWRIRPSGSVAAVKALMVVTIAAMIWSSMVVLKKQAHGISLERGLRGETEVVAATVVSVSPATPWTREVRYAFDRPIDGHDEEFSGGWVVRARGAEMPAIGSAIQVRIKPDRPQINRPMDTAAFWVLRPHQQVAVVVSEAVVGIVFALVVLLFQPPEDPFLRWITESG